jgi:prepilin-type N-terminal cleavage/methylation domain-containing protein/prepilin-type processing-associated H-X9-DG protein
MLHSMPTRAMEAKCRRAAFTLIELLVVVAIIGVIISILLPAMGKARLLSKATQCLSNQRSIGQAMMMYANQYKEFIPREGVYLPQEPPLHRRDRLPWVVAFRQFLDVEASPEVDLNDQFKNAPYYRDPARPPDLHNIHYVVNAIKFLRPGVADTNVIDWHLRRGPTKLARLTRPASTIYITDFFDDTQLIVSREIQGPRSDIEIGQFYDLWHPDHVIPGGSQDVLLVDRTAPRRHGSGGNAVFLDGHAEFKKAEYLTNISNWDDGDYHR